MPKYIVEGEVIIRRKFKRQISAITKDMAIKSISRMFNKAPSIIIEPQQDESVIVENLSAKRNRKRIEKRQYYNEYWSQSAKFIIGAKGEDNE